MILVGNKADVDEDMRQVSYDDGETLANELKILFIETSAKTS